MDLRREEKVVLAWIGTPALIAIVLLSKEFGEDVLFWTSVICLPMIGFCSLLLCVQLLELILTICLGAFYLLIAILGKLVNLINPLQGIKAVYNAGVSILFNPIPTTLSGLLYCWRLILNYFLRKRSKVFDKEEKLPGTHLLQLAKYICQKKDYITVESAVLDWQLEYLKIKKLNTLLFMPKVDESVNKLEVPHKNRELLTEQGMFKIKGLNKEYHWRYIQLIASANIISSTIRYFYLMARGG